jgi:hypothetical protein
MKRSTLLTATLRDVATGFPIMRLAFGPVVVFLFHRRFRPLRPRPQADADFAKIYV